jgi:alanine racemase
MAEKPTKVATIPMVMQTEFLEVGENGFVTIKIKKAKILGSVCMDMLMVTEIDCTDLGNCFLKAQLFRKWQKKVKHNTIPCISQRVKRVFYR